MNVPERSGPAAVDGLAIEPAAPLRPTQIASVQVDVTGLGGADEIAPMRLIVSQRGEQVNVRLRSFDGETAPLEHAQMQPLLNSLAEKGLVSEAKPATQIEAGLPGAAEGGKEKQLTMTETANGSNDSHSFRQTDERQQQNQERQQQQQAFFLRKQMKAVHAEEFSLHPMGETNRSMYQQGVIR
jgi:hypothetical protein